MRKITLILSLIILITFNSEAKTWYVNHAAQGDSSGTSWQNAFVNPQLAIDAALSNDTIWVASGIYTPLRDLSGSYTPSDSATLAFNNWGKALALYGGFSGNETEISQRNIEANPTILSGNIRNLTNKTDNCNLIFRIYGGTSFQIDGFILENSFGGVNMEFSGALSVRDVGVFRLQNCIVRNIETTTSAGCLIRNTPALIFNCEFYNNKSNEASAIYFLGALGRVFNSTFHHNIANSHGGAITFNGVGNSTFNHAIINSLFYNNKALGSAYGGGAVHAYDISTPIKIVNSTFFNNTTNYTSGNDLNGVLAHYNVYNSILYTNNTIPQIYSDQDNLLIIENSILKADTSGGLNNSNAYPEFTDTAQFNFQLKPNSPAINAGDTNGLGELYYGFDLSGNPRIMNGIIDIGAYEFSCTEVEATAEANGNQIRVVTTNQDVSFQWINCATNTEIVGETDTVFSPTTDGSYACVVSSSCSADTTNCIDMILQSSEYLQEQSIKVFPNPAQNVLNISASMPIKHVAVYSITGIRVEVQSIHNHKIDISNLTPGVYFIEVETLDQGNYKVRVLKN